VDILKSNSSKKVILVTAPAGYGKTTIVREYISNSNELFCWFHINKDISTVFIFLKYILHSLRKLKPEFGEEILGTISSIEADSRRIKDIKPVLDEIVYMVTNEFILAFDEKTTLVLDDFQDAGDHEKIEYALDKLISEQPDLLRLLIISRHTPQFNISHLRAKREIKEITRQDLEFSGSQIKHLADKLYSRNYSDEAIALFENSLGGWITGIHLLIQASADEKDIQSLAGRQLPDNLFDYFAEEIFAKQSPEIQNFLLTTAHLENFDSDLCDYLLGSTCNDILGYLSGKNIFIESLQIVNNQGNLVNYYNYIQLFRTFLKRKSKESLKPQYLKEIYFKASSYYSSRNEYEHAIDFSVLSEDFEKSSEIIINNYDYLFQNGKYEKMWHWITTIEQNLTLINPRLLYYKGTLSKYYVGKLDEASAYFEKVLELLKYENDPELYTTVVLSRTEILLNQGKFNIAIETLNSLKGNSTSAFNTARLFFNLGNAYFFVNKYDAAIEYLEKAMAICKENNIEDLLTDIYNTFGNIYINNGEFIISTHYYELTLNKVTSLNKKFTVLGNLSILCSRSAKFDKAYEFYKKSKEILKIFKTPIFEMAIKLMEYTLAFESGDFDSAFALAKEINDSAINLNSVYHIHLSYTLLGESAYYLGDIQKSKSYYNLALESVDKENEKDIYVLNLYQTVNKLSLNSGTELETELLNAYSYLGTEKANYDMTEAGFYLSVYYYKNGMTETAVKYLEKTITLAKEKEYYSFLLREYLHSKELFNFSLQNKIHRDTVKDVFNIISGICELGWINPKYRKMLNEKVDTLYNIRMNCFGGLEFIVNGKTVDDKKWIRKKRKLILCYLLLSNTRSLTKDKIIDVFFPDTPIDSMDNTFHQAVSNLRTALKDESSEKKIKGKTLKLEPDYLLYEGKILRLNPDYNYISDVEMFDRLTLKASADENDTGTRIILLESAVELYKGDFLHEYYDPWVENFRDEYRNKFIKYSELLLSLLDKENNYQSLNKYSQKLLDIDKLNEKANYFMIKSLTNTGKKSKAKEFYDKMLSSFDEEIGEKPGQNFIKGIENLFNGSPS
jgi:ATP/maltotriose-dependent transcriptional regulator MalT/DNA-binding SARP family transcriptional activator